jgi:hypothetical protein
MFLKSRAKRGKPITIVMSLKHFERHDLFLSSLEEGSDPSCAKMRAFGISEKADAPIFHSIRLVIFS